MTARKKAGFAESSLDKSRSPHETKSFQSSRSSRDE
jgi:hypothetical protein